MKIIISDEAKEDILQIFYYIASHSPDIAKHTIQNIRSRIFQLQYFPYIGRLVPELCSKYKNFYREILYKNYRIIYSIQDSNLIFIHTVIHYSKDLTQIPFHT